MGQIQHIHIRQSVASPEPPCFDDDAYTTFAFDDAEFTCAHLTNLTGGFCSGWRRTAN